MARERVVTRTIKTTVGEALAVDKEAKELVTQPFILSGYYDNKEKMLKALNRRDDGFTYTSIESFEHMSELYSMPEYEFIANATVVGNDEE